MRRAIPYRFLLILVCATDGFSQATNGPQELFAAFQRNPKESAHLAEVRFPAQKLKVLAKQEDGQVVYIGGFTNAGYDAHNSVYSATDSTAWNSVGTTPTDLAAGAAVAFTPQ